MAAGDLVRHPKEIRNEKTDDDDACPVVRSWQRGRGFRAGHNRHHKDGEKGEEIEEGPAKDTPRRAGSPSSRYKSLASRVALCSLRGSPAASV